MEDTTIDKYLNGELGGEEKIAFEDQLRKDQNLRESVELYQEMRGLYNEKDWEIVAQSDQFSITRKHLTFLQSEKGEAIKKAVLDAESAYFSKPSFNLRNIIWVGSVAAVLIIGLFVFFQPKNMDANQLYSEYYDQWEELPSLTSRSKETKLSEIEDLFVKKSYQQALELLQGYINGQPQQMDSQILLHLGVMQLESNKPEQAIQTFEQLANSDSVDAEKAQWYLGLSHLKMKNIKNAKVALHLLLKDRMKFKDVEAKEILSALGE